MVGSCGTEQSPSGQRVHAFIAEGSHAAYPQPCGGDGCWQTEASGETDLYPEQDFDGERKWGRNNDPAALLRLPPAEGWDNPAVGNWVDWPGKWGDLGGTLSPGVTRRYKSPEGPGVIECSERWTSDEKTDCEALAPTSNLPVPSLRYIAAARARPEPRTDPDEPDPCEAWAGPSVHAALCDPRELRAALAAGALGRDGTFSFERGRRSERSAAAPGIAQLVGSSLKGGDSVAVRGRITSRARLLVRTRGEGGGRFESRFEPGDLATSDSPAIEVQDNGVPAATVVTRDGRRLRPSRVRRLEGGRASWRSRRPAA